MNPHVEENEKFDELFRRVQFTCKARYNAARRLKTYHLFSQITTTVIAVGLVIIPLISILGFNVRYSKNYVDLMQIVFAVALLAYSLLLGIGNFSARAERMHSCGIDLGRLARNIFPYRKSSSDTDFTKEYAEFSKEYYDCLEKHENHNHIDFLAAKYDLLGTGSGFQFKLEIYRAYIWLHKLIRELISLSHFILSNLVIAVWIYFMIFCFCNQ